MRRKTGIIPEYDGRIDGQITKILSGLELLSAQVEESLEPMAEQIREDSAFVAAFTALLVDAVCFPVSRELPENVKEKLDEYLLRKRPK